MKKTSRRRREEKRLEKCHVGTSEERKRRVRKKERKKERKKGEIKKVMSRAKECRNEKRTREIAE
jgi:hypothetical protein